MGFLNDLKAKAKETMNSVKDGQNQDSKAEEYPKISHDDEKDDQIDSVDDDGLIEDDDDDDDMTNGMQSMRPNILNMLGIPANYKVDSDVLLPDDLSAIELSYEEPRGYSIEEVDRLLDLFSKSSEWYTEHLNMRNKDVATLASRLDKAATDLHNQKVNEALSEGLQVVTGQESTAETQLQKAQLEIIHLKDKLKELERANGSVKDVGPGDSRFDELQNQLGILQNQNRKLMAQNKRLRLGKSSEDEDSFGLDDAIDATSPSKNDDNADSPLPIPDLGDDDDGLPMPDLDEQVVKNESQVNESNDMFDLAEEEDNTDLDLSRDALKPKKHKKTKRKLTEDPDYNEDGQDDLPLPDLMNDSDYTDIGLPTDDDSGEMDLSDYEMPDDE